MRVHFRTCWINVQYWNGVKNGCLLVCNSARGKWNRFEWVLKYWRLCLLHEYSTSHLKNRRSFIFASCSQRYWWYKHHHHHQEWCSRKSNSKLAMMFDAKFIRTEGVVWMRGGNQRRCDFEVCRFIQRIESGRARNMNMHGCRSQLLDFDSASVVLLYVYDDKHSYHYEDHPNSARWLLYGLMRSHLTVRFA